MRPSASRADTTTLNAAPAVVVVVTVVTRNTAAGAGVCRSVIVPEIELTTARSFLPSPLKSAAAIQSGRLPTTYTLAAPNVPSPRPAYRYTLSEKLLTTASSTLPSPVRSATTTLTGRESASYPGP